MSVPTGIIAIWSGAIVNIPAGWALCNGAGATPDLRDRFVVGAGDSYAVNATGGNVNHNHSFTGDGHAHALGAGADLEIGAGLIASTSTDSASGTTDNANGLPPYYALAFIMKT